MVIRLALAALLTAVPASAAATTPMHETLTTAEAPAGTAYEWTVPEGVIVVTVTAAGGNGGSPSDARPGGRGAVVTVAIPVQSGQVLTLILGGDGSPDGTGGIGYGQGGNGVKAGGGGGSTAVLLDGVPTVVAGAGGGSSDSTSAGGGGNAGTPDGQTGSRRGGEGGYGGNGGIGQAPWGEPGGSSFVGGGGTVNGTETGAGGGAGYGGGGGSGAYGDGGGGGSYSAISTATFANRLDDLANGWVQLDYLLPVPEPTAAPDAAAVAPPSPSPQIFGIDGPIVGMVAAGIAAAYIAALAIIRIVRPARGRH